MTSLPRDSPSLPPASSQHLLSAPGRHSGAKADSEASSLGCGRLLGPRADDRPPPARPRPPPPSLWCLQMPRAGQVRHIGERTLPLCAAGCRRSDSGQEFIRIHSLRCARAGRPTAPSSVQRLLLSGQPHRSWIMDQTAPMGSPAVPRDPVRSACCLSLPEQSFLQGWATQSRASGEAEAGLEWTGASGPQACPLTQDAARDLRLSVHHVARLWEPWAFLLQQVAGQKAWRRTQGPVPLVSASLLRTWAFSGAPSSLCTRSLRDTRV